MYVDRLDKNIAAQDGRCPEHEEQNAMLVNNAICRINQQIKFYFLIYTAICGENQCGPNGICSRPKLCICENGLLKPSCGVGKFVEQEDSCNMRCMNGGKCVGNQCRCKDGYTGAYCGQRKFNKISKLAEQLSIY